jgi:cytochrome c peroxidase
MKRFYTAFAAIIVFISGFRAVSGFADFQPEHFPEPKYNFSQNPLKPSTIELGRALFYDPILSSGLTISCASCHSPYNAFAHTDHALSHGINDQIGTRNAPALQNLAWQSSFMWDGAITHLDMQSLFPITHPGEMNETMANVVHKLNGRPGYRAMFYEAFDDSLATGEHVLKALSQFMLSLVSAGTKYDSVLLGLVQFSNQEQNGYRLFQQHCNRCHAEPLMSTYGYSTNGLPLDTILQDIGRYGVTKDGSDSMLFKIPSLRNVGYTAPYMHDGRFKRLMDVINHYTTAASNTKTSTQLQLQLVEHDKVDLIAFLLTLSDRQFVMPTSTKNSHHYKGLEY